MERSIRDVSISAFPAIVADDPLVPYVRLDVKDGDDVLHLYVHARSAQYLGVELMTCADLALERITPTKRKRGKR